MSIVTLPQLLEAGVHFGHKASSWNPKMRPYIFAERNGIHIIDLVQTARYLNEAYEYVREGAEKGWRFYLSAPSGKLLGSLPTKPPAVAATTSISAGWGACSPTGPR
jgi:hypothetical protein